MVVLADICLPLLRTEETSFSRAHDVCWSRIVALKNGTSTNHDGTPWTGAATNGKAFPNLHLLPQFLWSGVSLVVSLAAYILWVFFSS
jgi:hypothetical protein